MLAASGSALNLLGFLDCSKASARWISGDKAEVEKLVNVNKGHIAHDSDGDLVFLTRLQWDIDRVVRDYPGVKLTATKEMMA